MSQDEVLALGSGGVQAGSVHEMLQLLSSRSDGVALAANQAGQDIRCFVVDRRRADSDEQGRLLPTVVCNPTIADSSPELIEELEGCLSFPDMFFRVKRSSWVDAEFDRVSDDGKETVHVSVRLEGFWARVFQHEVEHLDGKTFIDFMPQMRRMQIANELRISAQKRGR